MKVDIVKMEAIRCLEANVANTKKMGFQTYVVWKTY